MKSLMDILREQNFHNLTRWTKENARHTAENERKIADTVNLYLKNHQGLLSIDLAHSLIRLQEEKDIDLIFNEKHRNLLSIPKTNSGIYGYLDLEIYPTVKYKYLPEALDTLKLEETNIGVLVSPPYYKKNSKIIWDNKQENSKVPIYKCPGATQWIYYKEEDAMKEYLRERLKISQLLYAISPEDV